MKKLTAAFAILALCLQVFSGTVVYAAGEGGPLEIVDYDNGGETIAKNETVGVLFICSIAEGIDIEDISNIFLTVKLESDFALKEGVNRVPIEFTKAQNGELITQNKVELVYYGPGNTLAIEMTYNYKGSNGDTLDGKTEKTFKVGWVPTIDGSPSTPSAPQDTSGYAPRLGTTAGNRIPTIAAGSMEILTFPVKNSSIYQARNITMTLKMADEAKAPLVLEDFDLRQTADYINGNETKEVAFNVRILASAPEGLYPMKLNYDFDNAYNNHFTQSETVYIRVKNENATPKLTVEGISVSDADAAAGVVDLSIKIKNLGNLPAKDVKVKLSGLKSGGYTAYNSTDVRHISKVDGNGTATVVYRLLKPAGGAAGAGELSVKMDFEDGSGNKYMEENLIFVPSEDGTAKPNIAFDKIVSPQEALAPGREFEIGFDLKNGGGTAKNVKVSLAPEQGIVARSMNPVYFDKIDAASAKHVSFKLFATDDAATKNYSIMLNIEYEDAAGTKFSASQYTGVFVESGGTKTVPRIIIDNYSMEPFPVNAGSDFKLKMSFLNTSKTVDVTNIKVTVASDDGTFTPVDSGNTFYIENISRNESVEREMLLHVKPDAEQKSYMLSVNFEYEDLKGNPYTAKETMSVRVLQNPRLVIGDINMMPEAYVGQPVSVYLDFYNMGKSTLYNLMVKVEGEFEGQGLSYYVGNFESGRTDFFDTQFTPKKAGMQTGNILFTFEDANGKVSEIRKEFSLNVMEMQPQGPMPGAEGVIDGKGMIIPGKDGMPGAAQKPGILTYVIPAAAALVIIGIILFVVLRKRHKRRKEMSLDE